MRAAGKLGACAVRSVTAGLIAVFITAAVAASPLGAMGMAEGMEPGEATIEFIRIDPVRGVDANFIRGVDISTLEKVEHYGGRFSEYGIEKDPLDILRSRGVNWVRLKVWNDPVLDEGFNDVESVVRMAKRVKEQGFKLLLNFHYSDHWADPGRQNKPAAWADLPFPRLTEAVYAFTYDVVARLREAGALPDMVQVGNEIRAGMLWPDGKLGTGRNRYGDDFDRLAQLLKAGIAAVHDAAGHCEVKIALHLDDGGNNRLYRWWFDAITARGVEFDVIGLSYYPYWHGTLIELRANLIDISARYQKDVAVFETAYAFTLADGDGHGNIFGPEQARIGGYPVSVYGQAKLVRDVIEAVARVPDGRGSGVFYWEPAWLPVRGAGWTLGEGNAWENQAMFDYTGAALDSLYVFGAAEKPVIVGIEPVQVEQSVGDATSLPAFVTAVYSDGTRTELPVTWEPIAPLPTDKGVSAGGGEPEDVSVDVSEGVPKSESADTSARVPAKASATGPTEIVRGQVEGSAIPAVAVISIKPTP